MSSEAVSHLRAVMDLSERRACQIVDSDRTMVRHQSRIPPGAELRGKLRDLAKERHSFGYRRLFVLSRRDGEPSGINCIYRLYREEGLTVRRRSARRRAEGTRAPILVEASLNARLTCVTRPVCLRAAIPFAIGLGPVAARWQSVDLRSPCRP